MNTSIFTLPKKRTQFAFFVIIAISFCGAACTNRATQDYYTIKGEAQGTYYAVTFKENSNTKHIADSIVYFFAAFDSVFSNYKDYSLISRINKSENPITITPPFEYFWNTAYSIWKITNGAFDISIAPIINAWNFGYIHHDSIPTADTIAQLLALKAMDKMYVKDLQFHKPHKDMAIISNAIAKGYAVDKLAELLESCGVQNYLVDIGGEMKSKGVNSSGAIWNIAISKPIIGVDSLPIEQSYEYILTLDNLAMATSGNYRKFYESAGKLYSHTINPQTGYPERTNLLSATVIAERCIEADAIATACMVMGVEASKQFFETHTEYKAFLLYNYNDSICVYTNIDKKNISLRSE